MNQQARAEVAHRCPPAGEPAPGRVVVGADGSPESRVAIDLAADEACSRGMSLHVLAVAEPARVGGVDLSAVLRLRGTAHRHAEAARASAMVAARTRHTGLQVTGAVVPATDAGGHGAGPGDPVVPRPGPDGRRLEDPVLAQAVRIRTELEGCALLVVGNRGRRGVPAFAMGTTSGVLAAVSSCPVLVAPATSWPVLDGAQARPVVAAVDSRQPLPVLAAAAHEAVTRARPLVVLHAADGREPVDELRSRLAALARTVVPASTPTDVRVVAGAVLAQVLEAADDASVLVVGSRGTLALAGLALGSVSHEVLRAARLPVLVARAGRDQVPTVPPQQAGAS